MRIGTRGSALALWQARTVAQLVRDSGGPEAEIVVIRTSGDEASGPPDAPRTAAAVLPAPPAGAAIDVNVKRAFVKEIEEALLAGLVDVAVHSAKDLPAELPDGLRIAAALEREDPRDALLLPASAPDQPFAAVQAALGVSPRIGTSSVRRTAQLRRVFPGASFEPIRGNVDTRLRKLGEGEADALVLAAAGLVRLGRADRIGAFLDPEVFVPAPGQGTLALEARTFDRRQNVHAVHDEATWTALEAERALCRALGATCHTPIGAWFDGSELHTFVGLPDGSQWLRDRAPAGEALGRLEAVGARELLERAEAVA